MDPQNLDKIHPYNPVPIADLPKWGTNGCNYCKLDSNPIYLYMSDIVKQSILCVCRSLSSQAE